MNEEETLGKIVAYMKAHWPSQVKEEWQVTLAEYPAISEKVFQDFTLAATQNRSFIRIAGLSGSGKTSQILPAVEKYCEKHGFEPILIAARKFVKYHPHFAEIKEFYGDENLRKMTDEFATIMMFMTLVRLMRERYDIVLDVTLLDPAMEEILVKMLKGSGYSAMLLMIATSPAVTEHFLEGRSWRHTKETEQEFIRATSEALGFYAAEYGEMRMILWSVYDLKPVYDGPVKGSLEVFAEYSAREEMPKKDDDARREAKIKYLAEI